MIEHTALAVVSFVAAAVSLGLHVFFDLKQMKKAADITFIIGIAFVIVIIALVFTDIVAILAL